MSKKILNKARKDIKKNDSVLVLTGRDRGKTGVVLRVFRERNRALVEKVNVIKRHTKPNAKLRQGGVVEKESCIHLSNLKKVEDKKGKEEKIKQK